MLQSNITDASFADVKLTNHMGDDSTVVKAARVSYGGAKKTKEEDDKLLRYLVKNKHTSPFEHVIFTFEIELPIFVMRQMVRHRTFSINEISARYTKMQDKFFMPKWRAQGDGKNKQGSGDALDARLASEIDGIVDKFNVQVYTLYKKLLEKGVCREQARSVLPVSIYTKAVFTIDLHNFIHFLNLRLHPHAQMEVAEYAAQMLVLAGRVCPKILSAWYFSLPQDMCNHIYKVLLNSTGYELRFYEEINNDGSEDANGHQETLF